MTSGARPLTAHRQEDSVLAHWRREPTSLESLLPPGVRPDVVDGSAWVGLVAYVFRGTRVPPLPPPGPFGTLPEVTIEVLTVDDDGRHGVTYRTVETQHLPAIALARIGLGVPYTFARVGSRRSGDVLAHRSARPRGGPSSAVRVRVDTGEATLLQRTLATRGGIVARHGGRTNWWVRSHPPLGLRPAVLEELRGDLPDAVGIPRLFETPPDSLLVADAFTVTYAWGGTIR